MTKYKLKRQYKASSRIVGMFEIAFMLMLVTLLIDIGSLFLPTDRSYTLGGSIPAILLFGIIFLLVVALICANVILWIGMLHFVVKYDGRSLSRRILWFILVCFGLSFGAGLYYVLIYRKVLQNIPLEAAHSPY